MLVLPEPVMPKRSLVGLGADLISLMAVCWAELSVIAMFWLFFSVIAIFLFLLDFSTPIGRSRLAVEGRGER